MSTTGSSSAKERLRAFFFGRDVFISYCYADSVYAEALAVALQRLRFSVFLGAWGASPGTELSSGVSTAARQSRLLVVVATPASRTSGPVEEEIRYFADRHRAVIPVDVGLDIRQTRTDWPALAGTDVIREPNPQAKRPARPVITRIRNAAQFTRQTARLRRFVAGVFVVVAALIAVAAGAAMWSRTEVRNAQAKVAEAREGAVAANAERIGANILSSGAGLKAFAALLQTRAAAQQAQFADFDRRAAAADAEREAAIGSYIRMSNDAAAMLDMQPARLRGAALQAVQAVRFLEKRGTRAPAADRILRETLDLLPYTNEHVSYRGTHDWNTVATPDGRWLIETVSDRSIVLVNTDTGKEKKFSVPNEADRVGGVALSDDGTALAAGYAIPGSSLGDPRYAVTVWNLDSESPHEVPLPAPFDNLAVSNGGTFLAVHMVRPAELAIVRVADAAGLASTAREKYARQLAFTRSGDVLAITGGANDSGMWAWGTDAAPVTLPYGGLLLRHPQDESIVAVVGESLTVRNWKRGETLWSAPREVSRAVRRVSFSADGEELAFTNAGQGYIVSWRKPEGTASFPLRAGDVDIVPVSGGAAVVSYGDGSVDWLDASAPRRVLARAVHDAPVIRMVPRNDGSVRTVSIAGAMTWWPSYRRGFTNNTGQEGAAAVSPDASLIVVASRWSAERSGLVIHDETKWTPLIDFHLDWTAIALARDNAFYMGLRDGSVVRWNAVADVANVSTGPAPVGKGSGPVSALATGRGGRVAWASGNDVWIADGGRVKRLHHASAAVTALTFGSTDDELAAGTAGGDVLLWRRGAVTTFERQHRIESLAISADGRYVAATAHPQAAAIWEVGRPDVAHELRGDPANTIAFHPADGTVATGGQSGVVQVWSGWGKGAPLEVARFSSGSFVQLVRFTDDGRHLVAVPKYGNGAKWVWKSADLVAAACRRLRPMRDTGDAGGYDVICAGY